MNRIAMAILLVLICTPVFAGGFGIQADWNEFTDTNNGGDFGIGARVQIGSGLGVILSFDYYFVSDSNLASLLDTKFYEFNGNLAYWFPTAVVKPYFGGGIGFARATFNFEDLLDTSKSELGINILGGVKITGPVDPFIEFRYVFYPSDSSFTNRYVLTGGILF